MKNKNTPPSQTVTETYKEIAAAAEILQRYYTKLAAVYADSDTAKTYNFVRLEMKNLREALAE